MSTVQLLLAAVLVPLGGGAGSVARWALAEFGPGLLRRRWPGVDPDRARAGATVLANVVACFLLGVVVTRLGSAPDGWRVVYLLLAVGVCGGLSTLSTAALDLVDLVRRGATAVGLGYLGLTVGLSMTALWTGVLVTTWLT